MKKILGLIMLISFVIVSCKENVAPPKINGKWTVIDDSQYVGAGLGNHLVQYTGNPGDYFDFRSDGKIYVKEGSTYDTLSYQWSSLGTYMIISSFSMSGTQTCSIKDLTSKTVTINSPDFLTPGGVFLRTVNLAR